MAVKLRPAVLLLLMLLSIGTALAQTPPGKSVWPYGTFSSIAYNQEGGDLNGVEIRLIPTRTGTKGVIQFAEGEPQGVALVDVSVSGNSISFEMPASSNYAGTFKGVVSVSELDGTFRYSNGVKEHLELPRKQSYWDKK